MSQYSVVDFENRLRASGVLDAQQLGEIDYHHFSDARYLAKRLVEKELLTEWQAKLLLSGRNQMQVGGYLLLERLERNELGDRYLARQRNLDRTVELQFLPKEFGKKSDQFEPFIRSARMLIEVDHPNLAHVFDVGEEVGRYFVVQERVSGQTLDEIELSEVSPAEVLGWIRELASAINYLHRRSVLHGSIDGNEIIVTSDRHILLRGLIKRVLEEHVLNRSERLLTDAAQFGLWDRVALQGLLGELLAKTWGSRANAELLSAVVRLGQNADSLGEIESLASRELGLLESSASGIDHLLTPNAEKSTDPNVPNEATANRQVVFTKDKHPHATQSESDTVPIRQQTPKSRRVLIGGLFAIATGLLGGWAWLQFGHLFPKPQTEIAKANTDEAQKTPDDSNRGRKKKATTKETRTDPASTTKESSSLLSSSNETKAVDTDASDVVLGLKQDPTKRNDSVFAPVDVPEKETKTGDAEDDSDPIVDLTEPVKGIGAEGFAELLLGSSVTASSSASDAEKAGSKPSAKRNSKSASAKEAPIESTSESPKDQLSHSEDPNGLELPAPDGSGAFTNLMELTGDAADVSLDLILDPEKCGKGKNYFTLTRIPGKKEWNVQHSNRPDDGAAKTVAKFKFDDDGLWFAWETDVEIKSNANFLCNTCLEISSSKIQIIPLRKSLNIDSLMLNEKTFSSRTTLEVPWLPSDGIKLEFGKLDPAQFGTGRIANPQMVNRSPATISFRDDLREQVFFLAIAADFKNKVDFRLEVQTRNERGTTVSLTPKTLDEMLNNLDRFSEQMFIKKELAQNLADNAPYGEKTKRRDELKAASNALKEFQTLRQIAEEQAVLVRNLVNVPIPLRVVYEFQNQKIELARTPNYQSE